MDDPNTFRKQSWNLMFVPRS